MTLVGRWFRSLRPYSFPASLLPVVLATTLAVSSEAQVVWWALPFYALASLLFHAGTNVLNDYYDHLHGVDGPGDTDPSHVITRGLVSPRYMLRSGHLYFLLGVFSGSAIALVRGPVFFAVGTSGAFLAYLYTNKRFSLKYKALGDVAVFLLMGPALVFVGHWALIGRASPTPVIDSLPIAFLVTAILHGNNTRDMVVDRRAGIDTLAGRLGLDASKLFFAALIGLAYLTVVVLRVAGQVPTAALLPLLSLPGAVVVVRRVLRAAGGAALSELPLWASLLHFVFSLLYAIGFVL